MAAAEDDEPVSAELCCLIPVGKWSRKLSWRGQPEMEKQQGDDWKWRGKLPQNGLKTFVAVTNLRRPMCFSTREARIQSAVGTPRPLCWRSWMVLWRLTRPSRINTPKRCTFHYRGLECKSRKSRITWSNRKIWLGVQNEAGKRLMEFCQENTLVIANTLFQQYKRRLYTWTSPDGQHLNQIDYILCSQRWRSSIQSANTRPGADCGSDMNSLLPNSDLNWRK